MKGTHCGTRAATLAASLISLSAFAPAVANAAVPGLPAPAAPALPSIHVSVPVQAPALPAAKTVPVAVAGGVMTTASVSGTGLKLHLPTAWKKQVVQSRVAARHAKPGAKTFAPGAPVAKLAKAAKAVAKKAHRVLAWADTGPGAGCSSGAYLVCTPPTTVPAPVEINNRCTTDPPGNGYDSGGTTTPPPVGDEDALFQNGTITTWTSAPYTVVKSDGLHTYMKVLTFAVGVNGVGVEAANPTVQTGTTYKFGDDTVDTTIVEIAGPSGVLTGFDSRTYDQLIVNKGLSPNMWYYQHLSVNPVSGDLKLDWFIVCVKNQRHPRDHDRCGGHDQSGDYNKYKHHQRHYSGYHDDNDDSGWDQD